MHKLRRAAHVLTFASALAALTGFVVADVVAAETDEATAMELVTDHHRNFAGMLPVLDRLFGTHAPTPPPWAADAHIEARDWAKTTRDGAHPVDVDCRACVASLFSVPARRSPPR